MRVLLIKTSSLGDVIHALPAVTDACNNIEGIEFDWVVEEAFSEIPSWHPGVKQVIPIAWRRWRKSLGKSTTRAEMKSFRKKLCDEKYDLILDAQGLIKSAIVSRMATGHRVGLDRNSAREPIASFLYNKTINVPKGRHAISRLRELFAKSLGYTVPNTPIDYGLDKSHWQSQQERPYVVFIHGTTWVTKLWPEIYWQELCQLVGKSDFHIHLPWGTEEEHEQAIRIAGHHAGTRVLDRLSLSEMAQELANASAVVGVDSGLTHIAAALNIPTIAIYGATNPELTGVQGQNIKLISSKYTCSPCLSRTCLNKIADLDYPPCYQEITPERVWQEISVMMTKQAHASQH